MATPTGSHKPRVLVVGSSNTDLVVFCERLPQPGETVLGGDFKMFGGGKGANQAVAAARAGGDVTFLGAYGDDTFGAAARERLSKEGIRLDYFKCVTGTPSGVALILVDGVTRDNLIAVAKSANEAVDSAMISSARGAFETADVVISQLEIRDEAVEAVCRGDPNAAFPIFKKSQDEIARKAVGLRKDVRPAIMYVEKALALRSDP